jgi:hypothetical protein
MLSQRSMQRIRRTHPGLPGLTLFGLLALGCGQSEGGRCQIDSDCQSGLECTQRETGNGVCKRPGTGFEEQPRDASPDRTPATPEVEPDTAPPDTTAAYDTNASPDQAPGAAEVESDDAWPDAAAAHDTDASPDQAPNAAEVESDGNLPDHAAAHDTEASPDQASNAAEVESDGGLPDHAAAHDTDSAPDASASEAGAVDALELG